MKLLKSIDVAIKLNIGITLFKTMVKHQPDFPKAIRLTPKSHPQWRDIDIDSYLERKAA